MLGRIADQPNGPEMGAKIWPQFGLNQKGMHRVRLRMHDYDYDYNYDYDYDEQYDDLYEYE